MGKKNKKTILIIDDEPEIRDMMVDLLEKNNYETTAVENGIEALEYIKGNIPNMVIIDLLLPGEHGIDLLKIIKEEYFIPVIVISGIYKFNEVQHELECHLVEGFFEKPLPLDKFLDRVEEILSRDAVGIDID